MVSNSNGAVLFGFPGYSLGPKKKPRDFEKTGEKKQKSVKKRDFVEENKGINNKSAKIREAGRPKKTTTKNIKKNHFSAIFAKIWDPKIWDNSGDLSRSTRLHAAPVG